MSAKRLEKKFRQQHLIEERKKETFNIDKLLVNYETAVHKDVISENIKNRVIDCYPMPVNHLCEYTRDYIQKALNLPKLQDYNFKIKV